MDIRRRTYLLNLLSMGEVLYCGAPNSNYTYGTTSNKAFKLSRGYSQLSGLSIFVIYNFTYSDDKQILMMNFYKEDLKLNSEGFYYLSTVNYSVGHSDFNPAFILSSSLYLSSDGDLSFSTDHKYVYYSDRITVIGIPRTDI